MATNTTASSTTNRQKIRQCLRDFNFKTLFVEELGWDILNEHPLVIPVDGTTYVLRPLVEKRGVRVFVCEPNAEGRIPADGVLRKIEHEVIRSAYEHFIIYVDAAREHQVWLWVKREQGKRLASRMHRYHRGQSGELLAQKLERLAIGLEEEERLQMTEVAGRVARAFDVERVTKKFYDRFKHEHAAFLKLIGGIEAQTDREWYASLMLNRLMFIYFIQRKGFLDTQAPGQLDGDPNYLSNRLKRVQQERGEDQFHTFYRYFLLKLFHDGLSQRKHASELETLLGTVPYLNGGLFDVHVLERANPEIAIPDEAFEQLFAFLDEFDWYLDDRPLRSDREINPDVLGYIFEKYINQKQMGAYYTKEDITEYISKNTILPFLLDAAEQKCQIAFRPDGPVWSLLRENPDAYIYDAIKKGCDVPLPPGIEAGLHDVAQRGEWNKSAPEAYALPTEIWREVVVRRTRYQEVRAKLAAGEITSANDLITFNLDSRRFVEDVITYCTGTDLLRALYDSIEHVTVLDPTCGSGAFLFSALGILEGLYEACLERMEDLIEEREVLDAAIPPERRHRSPDLAHFRAILERAKQHPSLAYFIYKSIIIRNLYGVDIMEEATEICKLRLFLKLVSQVERFDDIEPLPDIDFNIRAGNTLVGFASHKETKQAIEGKTVGKAFQDQMIFDDRLERIEQKAQDIERAFEQFHELQVKEDLDPAALAANKQQLRQMLGILRTELDGYLASEYGIDHNSIPKREEYDVRFAQWQQSHQPFHWWVEFYGIMKRGGFDVIIGNPPYVEYSEVRGNYRLLENQYATISTGNLYAFTWERVLRLIKSNDWVSLIIPISSFSTPRMEAFVSLTKSLTKDVWLSQYAVRPSKLFVGVDMNLTIVISRAAGHDISTRSHFWTTMYQRWTPNFREFLFANITYVPVPDEPLPFNFAIPKLRGGFEERVLRKIYSNQPVSKLVSPHRIQTAQQLSYRTAGGRYYKIFLDRPLDSESKSNKTTSLREDVDVRCVLAALSSNLWWWYYTLHFDMYNCKDYMIFGFPFSYPANFEILDSLRILGKTLVDDLFKNAESKIQDYATTGARKQLIFVPSRSKPIIDEIDRVLARHYGFTNEELDFIINYDIKYRMGRDSANEEEE
jgi:Eco57I restriction-modification methylase